MKKQLINRSTSTEPEFIPFLRVQQFEHIEMIQLLHQFPLSGSPVWNPSDDRDLLDGNVAISKRSAVHQTETSLAQLLTNCKITGLAAHFYFENSEMNR